MLFLGMVLFRRIQYVFLIPLLFFSANCFSQKSDPLTIKIKLNPERRFQTMDHFGASDAWSTQFVGNWPDSKREAIADLLFSKEMENGKPKGIGLSMWRFNLGAGSAEQGDASGIKDEWRRAESFIGRNGDLDMGKAAGQVWFAKAAKERGTEKLLLFSNSPPISFTKNGKAYSSDGKSNLDERKSKDFANYISSVFDVFSLMGLEPKYISPINEPQWDWSDGGQEGSPYLNSEIANFVKILNESLEENKIEAKIDVAEAGKINYLFETADKPNRGEQVKSFFDKFSPYYLGEFAHVSKVISGHSYFTTSPIDTSRELRETLLKEISSIPGLTYWMSEYCILGGNEREINGNGRDLGMTSALYLARVIHQDLTISNASAWNWWIAVSPYNYKDGLIYIDKNKEDGNFFESKMLWALGNYSLFIRPGFERIEVETSVENQEKFYISGFQDPESEEIILVLINSSSEEIDFILDDYPIKSPSIKGYLTNERLSMEPFEIDINRFQLPAESIVTIKVPFK